MNDQLYAIVEPEKIDMLTKLIEAYDNLGIVSTLDRSLGLVIIRATEDTFADVEEILNNLPFPIHILSEDPRSKDI
ncbi:Uncharacterized [Syntrophomonas zehnderi OL-4]|uniref:Uncharacterized n=1 Tax=Syntrophomonas zehnderi OL-4 TaxID=690567 RepID=A0A0E4G9L0_9FIRM|nr:DUF4911 domain-containing protein [Syntrophomonas zehnderi]CFX16651.1 Uncharacterized [Syntrophomonas zehnderi OL-4]